LGIEQLAANPDAHVLDELAALLVDCVAGGASLGFLADLTHEDAGEWWRSHLAAPQVLTCVAREPELNRIAGTVSLYLTDKPNGRHRAEVSKLMVHREARGRHYASRLLATAEEKARDLGCSLLFLDTQSGSPAEGLYARRGWKRIGCVEDWAMSPDGTLHPTTIMSKAISR
jgi:GNAT superfamily N-acetyltransferase